MRNITFATLIIILAFSTMVFANKKVHPKKRAAAVKEESQGDESKPVRAHRSDDPVPYPTDELDKMDASKSDIKGDEPAEEPGESSEPSAEQAD